MTSVRSSTMSLSSSPSTMSGRVSRTLVISDASAEDSGAYTATYGDGSKAAATYGPVYVEVSAGSVGVPAMHWLGVLLMAGLVAVAGARMGYPFRRGSD